MSGDDREFRAQQRNKECRREFLFWIAGFLITHSVAFIFGIILGKILYG